MKGYKINIERATLANTDFRHVLYTAEHLQLVLMSLLPGEEIGVETHAHNDQFFRFESGTGKCVIDGKEYAVSEGDVVIIPAGAKHNIVNTHAGTSLKMYTIYAPPHHRDGIVRPTKREAENQKAEFDGKTTE